MLQCSQEEGKEREGTSACGKAGSSEAEGDGTEHRAGSSGPCMGLGGRVRSRPAKGSSVRSSVGALGPLPAVTMLVSLSVWSFVRDFVLCGDPEIPSKIILLCLLGGSGLSPAGGFPSAW